MPDFGIAEGIKSVSGAMDGTREATKGLTKSIEATQHDAVEVAQKQANDRIRLRREAEFKKEQALIKALESWKHKKQISDEEAKLKIDFVRKYGAKEWESVLKIKLDIENMERKDNEEYQHDLKEVRRVQFYCFALAAVIAWYLTWGYKG
jgi:hypothetical protein